MTFLTVDEAADLARCSPRVIRQAIRGGQLHAALIGGKYLIRPDAIQDWFDKRAAATPQPAAASPQLARHYSGVIRDLRGQPKVPAEEAIRRARENHTTRRRTG
jgi:excisionase family DNA binding protein